MDMGECGWWFYYHWRYFVEVGGGTGMDLTVGSYVNGDICVVQWKPLKHGKSVYDGSFSGYIVKNIQTAVLALGWIHKNWYGGIDRYGGTELNRHCSSCGTMEKSAVAQIQCQLWWKIHFNCGYRRISINYNIQIYK